MEVTALNQTAWKFNDTITQTPDNRGGLSQDSINCFYVDSVRYECIGALFSQYFTLCLLSDSYGYFYYLKTNDTMYSNIPSDVQEGEGWYRQVGANWESYVGSIVYLVIKTADVTSESVGQQFLTNLRANSKQTRYSLNGVRLNLSEMDFSDDVTFNFGFKSGPNFENSYTSMTIQTYTAIVDEGDPDDPDDDIEEDAWDVQYDNQMVASNRVWNAGYNQIEITNANLYDNGDMYELIGTVEKVPDIHVSSFDKKGFYPFFQQSNRYLQFGEYHIAVKGNGPSYTAFGGNKYYIAKGIPAANNTPFVVSTNGGLITLINWTGLRTIFPDMAFQSVYDLPITYADVLYGNYVYQESGAYTTGADEWSSYPAGVYVYADGDVIDSDLSNITIFKVMVRRYRVKNSFTEFCYDFQNLNGANSSGSNSVFDLFSYHRELNDRETSSFNQVSIQEIGLPNYENCVQVNFGRSYMIAALSA